MKFIIEIDENEVLEYMQDHDPGITMRMIKDYIFAKKDLICSTLRRQMG